MNGINLVNFKKYINQRQTQKYLVLNYDQYSEVNSAYLNIYVKEASYQIFGGGVWVGVVLVRW